MWASLLKSIFLVLLSAAIADWHPAGMADLGTAGLAATSVFSDSAAAGLTLCALAAADAVTRVSIATSSRSAFTTWALAASSVPTLPVVVFEEAFCALTVSVATARTPIAPVMISLLRTIGPP